MSVQKQFNFSKREELNDPWLLLLLLLHRRRLLLTVPWFVYHPQSLPSFIFSSSSLESWLEPVSHVPKHAHNGTSSKDWSSRSSKPAQSIFMSSWDATYTCVYATFLRNLSRPQKTQVITLFKLPFSFNERSKRIKTIELLKTEYENGFNLGMIHNQSFLS